jgi:GNAT superfamily N-acetyltransferase
VFKMSIFDKYDLVDFDAEPKKVSIPAFGLSVIIGSSGSGKTTQLSLNGLSNDFIFDNDKPIFQLFDSEEMAEKWLLAAGLRSVPAWRRTLSTVSNGERHRAEIAVKLSKGIIAIDEFTSLVDRDTARALCESINKNKIGFDRLVLATCHKDVLNWLDFDFAYDCDISQEIIRGSLRLDREIKLEIRSCETEAVWPVFQKHHYLSGKINKSASSFVALYNGKPVAMTSVIAFPSGNWKNGWRGHRTVVLPEFQGLGIGTALSDTVARYIVESGCRFFSKTAHPAMGEHRNKSDYWKATSKNMVLRKDYKSERKTKEDGHKLKHANRVCYSHEFVLPTNPKGLL